MAGDERSDAERGLGAESEVDFVVQAGDRGAAPTAESRAAQPPPRSTSWPPWLRQRATLAGAAVVLIVLGLASRAFVSHPSGHGGSAHPSASSSPAPVRSGAASPVAGILSATPPPGSLPASCLRPAQRVAVHTLPGGVTDAIRELVLPRAQLRSSVTQVGIGRDRDRCLLDRDLVADDAGVVLRLEVRATTSGDTSAVVGGGSAGGQFYVDHVAAGRTVHIEVRWPARVHPVATIDTFVLRRLAADPRLVQT